MFRAGLVCFTWSLVFAPIRAIRYQDDVDASDQQANDDQAHFWPWSKRSEPKVAQAIHELPDSSNRFITAEDIKTEEDFMEGGIAWNALLAFKSVFDFTRFGTLFADIGRQNSKVATLTFLRGFNMAFDNIFPFFNFVRGMRAYGGFRGGLSAIKHFFIRRPKWQAPVKGEKMGIVSFNQFAKEVFGREFSVPFFNDYYTGKKVPSWEDNGGHASGVWRLHQGYRVVKFAYGAEPMEFWRSTNQRCSFDNDNLIKTTWGGFHWMGPYDIKYASNGVYGVQIMDDLLERHNTKDALGVLMTYSVFSAHLVYNDTDSTFTFDLDTMSQYTPIPGFANLGGGAKFVHEHRRLRTLEIYYNNRTYHPTEDEQDAANRAFKESRLIGWRFAEKAVIASLLSMTNLVLHVKDLHLELAATFQVVTVDGFAEDPTNPVRRMLDPFVHRSVQATNDNFRLLFEWNAAEFSLAPLLVDEQLRLMDDAINNDPLILAELDMKTFAAKRGMDPRFSTKQAEADPDLFYWRWHYRSKVVEDVFDTMINCWINANYGEGEEGAAKLAADTLAQGWWQSMIRHVPSIRRSVELYPQWANASTLTPSTLRNVAKTLFLWLAWVHEDVGHAASAYVYNPVHTPMAVPQDGVGVPIRAFGFNVAAYRGFVFLNRAKLLDEPPEFWFSGEADKKCFTEMQQTLVHLGETDTAFSECEKTGFYSCVGRVETGVSS